MDPLSEPRLRESIHSPSVGASPCGCFCPVCTAPAPPDPPPADRRCSVAGDWGHTAPASHDSPRIKFPVYKCPTAGGGRAPGRSLHVPFAELWTAGPVPCRRGLSQTQATMSLDKPSVPAAGLDLLSRRRQRKISWRSPFISDGYMILYGGEGGKRRN